jgi:hemolysin D
MSKTGQKQLLSFSPFWHWSTLTLLMLPTTAVMAAFFTSIDIVAQGTGRVVPLSAVRPVDAQVAGEIIEVAVEPGAEIVKGNIILRLDDTELQNSLNKSKEKILQLQYDIARARSALSTAKAFDPADAEYEHFASENLGTSVDIKTELGQLAMAGLRAELITHAASVSEMDANIKSLQSQIAGIEAQIIKAQSNLLSETANVAAAKKLVLTKNIAQTEYERRSQAYETAKSDLAVAKQLFESKTAETLALRQRRKALVANTIRDWYAGIETAGAQLREQQLEVISISRRKELLTVRAPATGRIEEFKIHTIGARLAEGQMIARIVPAHDQIEIEARIPSGESSFLREQQTVVINLDAYPAERFGSINGKVRSISADSVQDNTAGWFYILRLSPEQPYLSTSAGKVELSPGMTVTVNVVTGNRRMISYLFEPILKALSNGIRER